MDPRFWEIMRAFHFVDRKVESSRDAAPLLAANDAAGNGDILKKSDDVCFYIFLDIILDNMYN